MATLTVAALSAFTALAQITVSGVVTDQSGEPLIGASVAEVGTQHANATDLDGKFTLKNVAEGATIRVSYVGYTTQEQTAAPQMTFELVASAEMMDEVVVVGYGSMKKSNLSGAVASVKADDLPTAGNASVGDMLRGRAAGMNITSSTATPGGALNIAIRGGLSGEAPLIVIDGVPQAPASNISSGTIYGGAAKDNSGLINLNPNDIESIDVLKDASAAAIYGSDASGGVILITTKRGREGKPEVSYSGSVAFSRIKDAPDFMNARDFMITQNQIYEELGRGSEKPWTQSQIDNFVGDGTNWMDEVTRTGVVKREIIGHDAHSVPTRLLVFPTGHDAQVVNVGKSLVEIGDNVHKVHLRIGILLRCLAVVLETAQCGAGYVLVGLRPVDVNAGSGADAEEVPRLVFKETAHVEAARSSLVGNVEQRNRVGIQVTERV